MEEKRTPKQRTAHRKKAPAMTIAAEMMMEAEAAEMTKEAEAAKERSSSRRLEALDLRKEAEWVPSLSSQCEEQARPEAEE